MLSSRRNREFVQPKKLVDTKPELNPAYLAVKQLREDFTWNSVRGTWTPRHRQKPQIDDESVA